MKNRSAILQALSAKQKINKCVSNMHIQQMWGGGSYNCVQCPRQHLRRWLYASI